MIAILVVACVLGVVNGFATVIQGATLYAGRAMAPAGAETLMPNGVQDAITPSWQTRLNLVWMLGVVGLLIYGSVQKWYWGILAVVVFGMVGNLARIMFSGSLATYLRMIGYDLANREVEFRKNGDTERANAAREFLGSIAMLTIHAAKSNQRVPSVRQASTTPFGIAIRIAEELYTDEQPGT